MARREINNDQWTERDSVLFATCEIALAAAHGRLGERPLMTHSFVLGFSPQERLLTSGSYALSWWGAVGDGTYEKRTTIVGGTGFIGVGLLGATAVGSALGNSARRNSAAAAACDTWRPVDRGAIHVSDHGFYLQGTGGFRAFSWTHVVQGDLPNQTMFQFAATTTNGTEQFCLTSDWAELVFALWALAMNRHHPRLVGQSWIDPAFFEKCRRHGYVAPLAALG